MRDKNWKVLIVDDEPNNLLLLGRALKDQYDLSFATDGVMALDVIRKLRPDIVLLDIMMPRMDGYEVLRRLKAAPETAKIPVIFVTAKTAPVEERKGLELGAADYLSKPISVSIAKARIKNHLELKNIHDHLEELVGERTAELEKSNAELKTEIDSRKRMERLLRNNQDILRSVLDSFPEAAFVIDKSGKIIVANDVSTRTLDIKEGGQILDSTIRKYLSFTETEKDLFDTLFTSEEARTYESIYNGKILRHLLYPVLNKRGETIYLVSLSFDITARRYMEMQFIQREKLASIGYLASGIAHEINNPNNFISFNIPILRDYVKDILPIVDEYAEHHEEFEPSNMKYPEFREDLFRILLNIEHGSQRITHTVSLLRDFSRKEEKISISQVDIKNVFEKALVISRGKIKRLVKTVKIDVPEGMPRIPSDEQVIEQIVINLLINAAHAVCEENAVVELRARVGKSPQDRFIIEINDNGVGMDAEMKMKAFEPFFTTKPRGEGTGLGLSLCQTLASVLKGKIEFESEPGKGSTFRLVLPEDPVI